MSLRQDHSHELIQTYHCQSPVAGFPPGADMRASRAEPPGGNSRVVGLTRSVFVVRHLPPGFLTLITILVLVLVSHYPGDALAGWI